ncbi:tRNA-guanine transglycosylase [Legionella tunisiensis]|uniref:tRNA-guanine transglycosylase n=1 Tax=Legionella tunisiensis TaxID=1034944 RepID=UPI00035C77DD|nr:tRNA-guanine transglycosylase [Legionella tunisiensis]
MSGLTPVLTTEAGNCLTVANWQEVGIKAGVYYLDALLMKPGIAYLKKFAPLSNYTGWQGITVLNASLSTAKNGVYSLRSCYDGSRIDIDQNELLSLIGLLQPDRVALPYRLFNGSTLNAWQTLAKTSVLFASVDEHSPTYPDWLPGRYIHYGCTKLFSDFIQELRQYADSPLYLAGEFESEQLQELAGYNVWHVESDKPARDAMRGRVYSQEGVIDILDSRQAEDYRPIANCSCPTCQQLFTRAYLHHLIMHTPLLCQRFLIQHNVHYYQQMLLPILQTS